jgi:hypothetical protein
MRRDSRENNRSGALERVPISYFVGMKKRLEMQRRSGPAAPMPMLYSCNAIV